jgi:hypothetical protein
MNTSSTQCLRFVKNSIYFLQKLITNKKFLNEIHQNYTEEQKRVLLSEIFS